MSRVTIKDVAAAAGVGIATVSRVARNSSAVSAGLRQRVESAMEELGYEPNANAQTMRTRSSRTIACAIRDSSIPEFATFIHAAETVVRQAGYTLMLTNTAEDPTREMDLIKTLSRRGVDGIFMTKSQEGDPAIDQALDRLGIPVVFIDRYPSAMADTVVIDHKRGISSAIDHLVSLGHERIALVTGRPTMRPGQERLHAYYEALKRHGIEADPRLVSAQSFSAEHSFHYVSLLLGEEAPPTAIIAGGMSLLPAVLRAIRLRGLEVGRDISLIAGCDSDLAELTSPAITAIRWDVPAWGRTSAQLLLDRLSAPETAAGRQIILPTELVIRGSCARPVIKSLVPVKTGQEVLGM